ncbi:hypothetical protein, partial [Actinomadura sp. 7K507]|uniref:hypothetical protein n=1 Tax=Actinomadura sp. 7K507 TaxID=2530365 RepID=UPI001404822A
APADGTEQPHSTDTQTNPGDEPTSQNSEGNQPTTDNVPLSPEEPDQNEETGQHDSGHDKKAEDTDAEPSPNEINETNREGKTSPTLLEVRSDSRGRINFEPRYRPDNAASAELAPREANMTEVEEPGRFQGRIRMEFESDGRLIPPSRDTGNDTPGHGEPRHPDDDPASRDYRASDPERRSRGREFMREFVTKSDDTKTSADKFAEPAQKKFERVEPTGQHSGARSNNDYIRPLDQPVKTGDAMVGGVALAIVFTEAFRYGARNLRKVRGSEHDSN